ncbi:GGDEF domain-containing protein [Alteromonas sediminis]|uniref:GGDEF domain-containing protein n=1 Tax=Alteromonas sediminis TaxID=2259342 RepID=A0A3N5Y466_9ALTE|nr:GGDEF domain-containing protein [Alteromonas sediminis]RPJ67863.1 GGDEF domain-containing protein [Alteromonas sediminis]
MEMFYTALMTINAMCAVLILISGIQHKRPYLLTLALLNVMLFLFHAVSVILLAESNVVSAITLSRYHMAIVIFSYPLLFYSVAAWTGFRQTKTFTLGFIVVSVVMLIVNAASDMPLRYGENVSTFAYQTMFGDSAYLLVGESGALFPLFHLIYGVICLFLCYCAYRFYQRKHSWMSLILVVTVLMQIASGFIGYQLDSNRSFWVYMGGVPPTFLSLGVLFSIVYGFKQKSQELDEALQASKSMRELFADLAKISNEPGESEFYLETMRLLADFSRADFALLGLVDTANIDQIRTRVALKNALPIGNFSYQRRGTPCENVLSIDACVYQQGVADIFPTDLMLKEEKIESYIGYPVVDADNQPIGLLVLLFTTPLHHEAMLRTIVDIFATRISAELRREKLQEELKATAYTDYLTRLPNRTKLLQHINRLSQSGQDSMLMQFDLDHFGEVNQRYGYDVGDQIIRIIGERLSSYASDGVFVSRNGGDEFAVVLPNVRNGISSMLEVHWTAIQAIITRTCYVGHRRIHLDCSMGAVVFPSQLHSHFDVIGAAEHALARAKEEGRGRSALFNPSLLAHFEYTRDIEQSLVEAVEKNKGLSVFYQPKVDKEGSLLGAEALLRWHSEERGFISPAEFIPIAEETGAIHALGLWVIQTVFTHIQQWQEQGKRIVPISINVTASQFDDESFLSTLLEQLIRFHIPKGAVELELTESGLLRDKKSAIKTLAELRAKGIGVALDDFGTGYSSLSYLSELPINVLKIDKSFVDRINDEKGKELIRAIIAISQTLGLDNVAEGTETLEQVELLSAMGCSVFQGYYFSKPIDEASFSTWLT